MKNTCSLLAALTCASLLAGCQSPGAKAPKDTTRYDYENQLNAVLLDSGAQRSVTYSGIQERRTPDDRIEEVAANVRNRENRRIQVQINCEFKDAQGFTIESTPFQNLFLTENAQETVRFTPMTTQAKRYTIRIRQAR